MIAGWTARGKLAHLPLPPPAAEEPIDRGRPLRR